MVRIVFIKKERKKANKMQNHYTLNMYTTIPNHRLRYNRMNNCKNKRKSERERRKVGQDEE